MDCARFEAALAALLEGRSGDAGRQAALDDLRRHAEACKHCRGTVELLDLLALPPGERDLVEQPPESYWEELQSGVRRRLQGVVPTGRPSRLHRFAAAAAVLLAVTVGMWVVRDVIVGISPPVPDPLAGGPGDELELPPGLERLLQRAASDEVLAGMDFLAGLPGAVDPALDGGAGEGIFPDVETMDPEARGELLQWLKEEPSGDRGVES
jgi:hypothetical protein